MDIVKFQQKLEEICTLGEENGKVLTPLQVRECFQGMELDKNQLLKVLQYLKLKGISIEGMEVSPAAEDAASEVSEEEKKVSLTAEEEAYVKEYLEELKTAEKAKEHILCVRLRKWQWK